ncbi:MAG: hypothetical protein LKI53_03385, partial [Bacteroidales bacterium]|nr:hypothetical protein [Bacteroidales bacterium]
MKKVFCLFVFFLFAEGVFSQVYKRENVYSSGTDRTYLSYWKPLDKKASDGPSVFELRGNKAYTNDSTTVSYDVHYYKANASKMFAFLSGVSEFAGKYSKEDDVITFIDGVKIRTQKLLMFRNVCVYDTEDKVHCSLT